MISEVKEEFNHGLLALRSLRLEGDCLHKASVWIDDSLLSGKPNKGTERSEYLLLCESELIIYNLILWFGNSWLNLSTD